MFEELDSPNEWWYDEAKKDLYFFHNGTGSPEDFSFTGTSLQQLVTVTGAALHIISNVRLSNRATQQVAARREAKQRRTPKTSRSEGFASQMQAFRPWRHTASLPMAVVIGRSPGRRRCTCLESRALWSRGACSSGWMATRS